MTPLVVSLALVSSAIAARLRVAIATVNLSNAMYEIWGKGDQVLTNPHTDRVKQTKSSKHLLKLVKRRLSFYLGRQRDSSAVLFVC